MKRTAFLAILAISALAAGHEWMNLEGVHFNAQRFDLGWPPAKYADWVSTGEAPSPVDMWRPGTIYVDSGNEVESDKAHSLLLGELMSWGFAAEHNGHWAKAVQLWSRYRRLDHDEGGFSDERVQVCYHALHGLPISEVRDLLANMWPRKEEISVKENDPFAVQLTEYNHLLRCCPEPTDISDRYLKLYRSAPNGPFAADSLLESAVYELDAAHGKSSPADLHRAAESLHLFCQRFPTSRLIPRAIGWKARVAYLRGSMSEAVQLYRWQFQHGPPDDSVGPSLVLCGRALTRKDIEAEGALCTYGSLLPAQVAQGSAGLMSVLRRFSSSDARRFWSRLDHDPRLLDLYLDYRLQITGKTHDLLALAQKALDELPSRALSAQSSARLAQVSYEYHRDRLARGLAEYALNKSSSHETSDLARFVLASLEMRSNHLRQAADGYRAIYRSKHPTYLAGGALTNLAWVQERRGDLPHALDLYRELNSAYDVAYLLDVKMTADQVVAYANSHRLDHDLKALRLAAGIRLMRDSRWHEAAIQFRAIDPKVRAKLMQLPDDDPFDHEETAKLRDPLLTLYDLAHLDRAIRKAKSAEQKARAGLEMADYFYNKRDLLLYNPRLWHGNRAAVFQSSWNDLVATNADRASIYRYHWQHECLARAYLLYKAAAQSGASRQLTDHAAYWAGVCEERLANINEFWRWVDGRHHLVGHAAGWLRIASRSAKPALAQKAKKYAEVFTDESEHYSDREYFHEPSAKPHFLQDGER